MTKKPNRDIPGDAVATAAEVTRYWYDVGLTVGRIDRYMSVPGQDAPELYEVRIKCDPGDPEGVLVILKALAESGYVIGFHRGETIVEALTGASRRLQNHTLKWRVDEYASNSGQ